MNMLRWVAALVASVSLLGCGGGGSSSGSSPFNPNPPPPGGGSTAATIEVLASGNSVGTGGDTLSITAIVKDANNNSLASAPISFSTDTGTLSGASATTDSAGVATATFSAGADRGNRTATITVTSGSITGTVTIAIEGSKLSYSGVTTLALSGQTTLTVTATDSKGNAVSGIPVTVSSSLNNGLSATSGTTDVQGQVSFTYTATNSGSDTITFTGLNASVSTTMTISGEDFVFITPSANQQVTVGTAQTVTVRYRKNGVAQPGQAVTFATTIGSLSANSGVTDASGTASVTVSSSFAGSALVTAALSGATVAQATLPLQFIATVPAKLVLQIAPTALAPNLGSSNSNQATATAKVTDASGNPVTGVTVNFSQLQDLSGGMLQQATAVTDNNGAASVKYIAGANSTASGGVILKATVASNTAISDTAALTVNQSALFIALGTGNTISNVDPQTYKKDWTVYVTDANGVAVSGVTITIKVLPVAYGKGSLTWDGTVWSYSLFSGTPDPTAGLPNGQALFCANEDLNYNGSLDSGEDANGDGVLWPGNVISVTPGTLVTDSTGRATLSLIYAESYVPWVQVALQVQAIVQGTASTTTATFVVDGLATDFNLQSTPPAGVFSPFGRRSGCSSPF